MNLDHPGKGMPTDAGANASSRLSCCDWRATRRMGPAFAWARGCAQTATRPLRPPRLRGAGMLAGCLCLAAIACGSAQDALSLTNSAMASVWPVWGNMFIAPAPTQR